jgi:hypothetical protein
MSAQGEFDLPISKLNPASEWIELRAPLVAFVGAQSLWNGA